MSSDSVERLERQADGIVEGLQSLIWAFIVLFVFRGFLIEPFVIPTGSMAPTLLGAHVVVTGPDSGYAAHIGPGRDDAQIFGLHEAHLIRDPMLWSRRYDASPAHGPRPIRIERRRARMGDRIFVLKHLYAFRDPQRYDIVVFKDPVDPTSNFIKRLIGLPGENIWLADGDIFVRREEWAHFRVQRKPEHVQRRAWQPVCHSDYVPLNPEAIRPTWSSPWSGRGWDTSGRHYRYDGQGPTTLAWQHELFPITDYHPYNALIPETGAVYVSDIRLAAVLRPEHDGLTSTIRLAARCHEFEAVMGDGRATLRMRHPAGLWSTLDSVALPRFAPTGRRTNVEFRHVDQALWLWIDGRRVAYGEYEWDALARVAKATGRPLEEVVFIRGNEGVRPARIEWDFSGGPITLTRVQLDRDLFFRSAVVRDEPGFGTHPENLARLGEDQFYVLGDNSAASADSRHWGPPDPWVARAIDDQPGVVHRDLLVGKAFFVFFPSPEGLRENLIRFVPNFGEMRFIQ